MKSAVALMTFLLCFQIVVCPALAVGDKEVSSPHDASLRSIYGERQADIRAQKEAGIYFAPRLFGKDGSAVRDNSSGYKISENSSEAFAESFANFLDAVEREDVKGDLLITQMPLWRKLGKNLASQIQEVLVAKGIDPKNIKIKLLYQPQGTGVRRAIEELRYFFPMAQDYEAPSFSEVAVGTPATLLNESTTAAFAFSQFPLLQSLPLLAGHFALLTGLSAFSKSSQNWMNRSRTKVDNLIKQFLTCTLFIINYNAWTGGLDHPGEFVVHQGVTAIAQTGFFWLTFGQGLWKWDGLVTSSNGGQLKDPNEMRKVRTFKAVIQPLIFVVSGPLLAWASTSQQILASFGGIDINPGQLALAAAAGVGAIFVRPWLLNPASEYFDRFIAQPLRRFSAWIRSQKNDGQSAEVFLLGTPNCAALFSE